MTRLETYKIKADDINAITMSDAQDEILAKYADDIEWLSGVLNIAQGDLIEAITTHIVTDDEDWTPSMVSGDQI